MMSRLPAAGWILLLALGCLLPWLPARAGMIQALIQLRGTPLSGGRVQGSASVPLERAPGGDTPVLSFSSAAGPVRLLLDTGASSSMVSPALADRLGLESQPLPADSFDLAGGGKGCDSLQSRRVRLPRLLLRSGERTLSLSEVEALLLPVAALPPGIDGVLGAPSLRLLPFLVDPGRERLDLGAEALEEGRSGSPGHRLPLRWNRGVPVLRIDTTAGSIGALADTGAEGLFLSPSLSRRLLPLGPAEPLRLVGVCGEQPVQRQTFAGIRFPPGAAAAPVEGIITDNPIFAQLGVEAILGQELLRQRRQRWRLDQSPPHLELW